MFLGMTIVVQNNIMRRKGPKGVITVDNILVDFGFYNGLVLR